MFGVVMHMDNLLETLCKSTQKEVLLVHKCDNKNCLMRFYDSVKLYMTVRIHHALKISNIGMTYGHKRNQKMLKLCHE